MKSPKTIFVTHLFSAKGLHTREQAQRLVQEAEIVLLHHEPVWLDFTGIDFMSRSFADEFLKLSSFWRANSQLDWCGLSSSLNSMIELVGHSRMKNATKTSEIPSVVITDEEVLFRFFEAV